LGTSGLDFDANTVQAHVNLVPFGRVAELGIYVANNYNAVLATLFNAVATSAPFWKGETTGRLSNREQARNNLSTIGGVQDNLPLDAHLHLMRGHDLMQRGKIPAPERAGSFRDDPGNGSHKDTRPAKYSTGTIEFGAADMVPNVDFWIVQMIILRQFTWKMAQTVIDDQALPFPSILSEVSFEQRVKNRREAALYGNQAQLITSSGKRSVNELWNIFFKWVRPHYVDNDWNRAEETMYRMLQFNSGNQYCLESYFNDDSAAYMRGNVGQLMQNQTIYLHGDDEYKIKQTNKILAKNFMEYLGERLQLNAFS
jgi:gamma-glutamyl:cysteine ligase YbdK (ATP-grasp superfamily)